MIIAWKNDRPLTCHEKDEPVRILRTSSYVVAVFQPEIIWIISMDAVLATFHQMKCVINLQRTWSIRYPIGL
jgi:hypothetical protein